MGSDATLQNIREIRARLQNGNVNKPNDAIYEVTGGDTEYPLAGLPTKLVLGDYSLCWNLTKLSREAALLVPES